MPLKIYRNDIYRKKVINEFFFAFRSIIFDKNNDNAINQNMHRSYTGICLHGHSVKDRSIATLSLKS